MATVYSTWLVLLSITVAVNASFVALDLTSRIVAARSAKAAGYWLVGGAICMGAGIWCMHFIGLLAVRFPIRLSYDIRITLLSLLIAIVSSGFALFVATRGTLNAWRLLGSGLFMAAGIASMHYVGMQAARIEPPMRCIPSLFALSLLVAFAASVVTIWSAFHLCKETILTAFWRKAGSALVMSAGICGMHYLGVAATRIAPGSVSRVAPQYIDREWLGATLGAFTLVFLIATLVVSAYDAHVAELLKLRMQERTGALDRTTAVLQRLLKRLVDAQDEERRRLAAELHDIVGQNIAALNSEITLIRVELGPALESGLADRLKSASVLARQCVEAVRLVMAQLRPPGLDVVGLPSALRWHADALRRRAGVDIALEMDDTLPRPSTAVEDAVLRIYVEALSNIAKHARARVVRVQLEQRDGTIALRVFDDGVGFDADHPPPIDEKCGWGLMIMRERAQQIGAELHIRSRPGAGTLMELLVSQDRWK